MAGFKITQFSGIVPRVPESLLPEHMATIAQNCDLAYGELRHAKSPFLVSALSAAAQSIYTEDGLTFYSWASDVDAVRAPLAKDNYNRLYFTGDGFKVASRGNMAPAGGPPPSAYLVGVPRPTVAPTIAAPAATSGSTTETCAYVFVYVNAYDEPGPPSDPTLVTTDIGSTRTLTITKDVMGAYVPLKYAYIYRTPTGSTNATYYYVGKVDLTTVAAGATTTFADNVPAAKLAEPLSSLNAYPPPQDLKGLMALPNGILCAWRANEIWFSDAYRPWSWNPANVKTTTHNIVGGLAVGSGAVITTVTTPYLLSGVSPDAMTASKINASQAGVSKWAIAQVGDIAIFASHDGLVTISGASASLAEGQSLFTRDVWRQRCAAGLATMRFAVWDGRLIAYSSAGAFTPFMIQFDEASGVMTELPAFQAACSFTSQLSDQCYFVNGSNLYQFAGADAWSATWQSREAVTPAPLNLGFAQAVSTGAWTLQLYADGALVHTENIAADGTNEFRLPDGYLARRFKLQITGKGRFRELRMATTAKDLARV